MLIRKYTSEDFQAIADIYNESISQGGITMDCYPYSADDIRALTDKFNDRETILVLEATNPTNLNPHEQSSVVGWGTIKRYSDRPGYRVCCETSIYLSLQESGKGYGKALQTNLLQHVRDFGYHHVVAKIAASNHRSITFHQQFGFERVGIQKEIGYLKGTWCDIAILQLVFPQVPPYRPELG